jgi:1-acyl-sn-glycerol-3-phosphate acyltransferase
MARPAPLPTRVIRSLRVAAHVAEGLATAVLVFPVVKSRRRNALTRNWSRRLLRMLNVDARLHGHALDGVEGNLLIVANHISWLDIFVLLAARPARFVAKAELRRWPVVGPLITGAGTLYVERTRRHDTHKVNRRAAEALARGDVLAIFPEGTTTDGRSLLPFHGSLLQPIVDAQGHVVPVAIRYRTPAGEHTDAAAYVGDTSILESFWRLTAQRAVVVDVHVAAPLPAHGRHRRELSRAAEAIIRTALASPETSPAPGTPGDPRAEPP